ncbi:hypothetical protein GCM10029963_53560 [Micromonospora andamanensis]|uniref:hypothetical protein n=1 Tax=Micromonospora andamanensis TaxID=1287068 RepID=UPI001950574B|nr:hypothetical protein [Micromonospora andamanensis]GIJ36717.1 hypothetical protein Vwe01_00420 [Micromonospora andamanensis]
MEQIVPEPSDVRRRKGFADRAYLLRVIARTVTESLPAPLIIETDPAVGYANLRFDDDAVAAVKAWGAMLGVETDLNQFESTLLPGWRWIGNGDRGTMWHGWELHIWCKVTGSADSPPADPARQGTWPAPGQPGREDDVAFAPGGER